MSYRIVCYACQTGLYHIVLYRHIASYQVITACGHKVGWLIAKKSFDRLVPGFFARALSGIPVVRPQVTVSSQICYCWGGHYWAFLSV